MEKMSIKEKMTAFLKDEENGVDEYNELAKELDTLCPDKGYGFILRNIAKEESIHKKLIKEIMDDMFG